MEDWKHQEILQEILAVLELQSVLLKDILMRLPSAQTFPPTAAIVVTPLD